jgi:DNA-binding Xre family transcriptional regulator
VRRVGYHWHLRRLMAERDMFATTDLRPLLADRGVVLSREQVYRLVTGTPQRLSLKTLAALCDILACTPSDLVEPYRKTRVTTSQPDRPTLDGSAGGPAGGSSKGSSPEPPPRPRRARIVPDTA